MLYLTSHILISCSLFLCLATAAVHIDDIEQCDEQLQCLNVTRSTNDGGQTYEICLIFDPSKDGCSKKEKKYSFHSCSINQSIIKANRVNAICNRVKCGESTSFGIFDGTGCKKSDGLSDETINGISGISCSSAGSYGGYGSHCNEGDCEWLIPAEDCPRSKSSSRRRRRRRLVSTSKASKASKASKVSKLSGSGSGSSSKLSKASKASKASKGSSSGSTTTPRPTTADPTPGPTPRPTTADPTPRPTPRPTTPSPTTPAPTPCTDNCPLVIFPVCCTDNQQSYDNRCLAICDGCSNTILSSSGCTTPSPTTTSPTPQPTTPSPTTPSPTTPAPTPCTVSCGFNLLPVCCTDTQTAYDNECLANCDGCSNTIQSWSGCPTPAPTPCSDSCGFNLLPVCCTDNQQAYDNQCLANCDGCTNAYLSWSGCPPTPSPITPAPVSCTCPLIYAPVCGQDGNTYSNDCFAECHNVAVDYDGACIDGNSAKANDKEAIGDDDQYQYQYKQHDDHDDDDQDDSNWTLIAIAIKCGIVFVVVIALIALYVYKWRKNGNGNGGKASFQSDESAPKDNMDNMDGAEIKETDVTDVESPQIQTDAVQQQ